MHRNEQGGYLREEQDDAGVGVNRNEWLFELDIQLSSIYIHISYF